jgi:hypothetical protein
MSMTTQNWQCVESGRDITKPKKSADPMAYLAVLVILVAISTLMMIFCSIGSAHDNSPDGLHASPTTFASED